MFELTQTELILTILVHFSLVFPFDRDAIKKAIRVGKRNERIFIGSGLAAVAIAWVITEPW